VPWYLSSQEIGIPPVLTHAAIDLFNWKLKNPELPFSLENIEPIHFFNIDSEVRESEKWFYLPMIAIEGECGCILHKMEEIYQILEKEDTINTEKVKTNLKFILQKLVRQFEILKTIERCDPEHFYHLIRPYLAGSKQKDSPGWYLEGIEMYIEYGGGSAAQSSLIQAEDIFLGVEHPGDDFLKSMREYMPEPHKQYLQHQETRPGFAEMKQLINSEDYKPIEELRLLCVEEIKKFRKFHYSIVQKYVMRFNSMTGTGGTDINRNLRDYINNTQNTIHNQPKSNLSILELTSGDILVTIFWLGYLYLVYWYFTSPTVDALLRNMHFPE
jgi:indoleamine 2,3-dioxygenase